MGLLRLTSIHSPPNRPISPAGKEARIMHQARWCVFGDPWRSNNALVKSISSLRKNIIMARRVPKCRMASRARPWSSKLNKIGANIKCPELEIGRNSVSPWIMLNKIIWKNSICLFWGDGRTSREWVLSFEYSGNQHGLLLVQEDTTPSNMPESRKKLADWLRHKI